MSSETPKAHSDSNDSSRVLSSPLSVPKALVKYPAHGGAGDSRCFPFRPHVYSRITSRDAAWTVVIAEATSALFAALTFLGSRCMPKLIPHV